jgi:glycosyltransferase involved in cell wall biosynthesis
MSDDRSPLTDEQYADYLKRQEIHERFRESQQRDPAENYTPPSFAAKHPLGVLYQGEFETPSDGTAQAVRLHARALASTGLPLALRSFSNVVVSEHGVVEPVHTVGIPPEVDKEVGHLLSTDIAAFKPVIKHVVIRSAEHCRQLLMPRGAVPIEDTVEAQMAMRDAIYNNTIVYSVWERDRIDEGIARHLARVKQCWVPCRMNQRLLVEAGVPADRVHLVPHPYTEDDMIHVCTKRKPGCHDGWRRFYSIGRWEPRKGFAELIDAFLLAFTPDDKVSLTIKYSGRGEWPGYPSPQQCLEERLRRAPEQMQQRVKLIDGRVQRSMIVKLHYENNIYVSASHGEAFGLPAFDAKLAGNALVCVPFGGVADLSHDSDIQVPCEMASAHPSYRWEHDAKWAVYRQEDLVEGLRRARVPDEFCRPPGYDSEFSLAAVGRKMRELVDVAVGPGTYQS